MCIVWGSWASGSSARSMRTGTRPCRSTTIRCRCGSSNPRGDQPGENGRACAAGVWDRARAVPTYRAVTENPDIDIVHICTPNNCHQEALLSAMRHGKHIYCDKPLVAIVGGSCRRSKRRWRITRHGPDDVSESLLCPPRFVRHDWSRQGAIGRGAGVSSLLPAWRQCRPGHRLGSGSCRPRRVGA